LTGGLPGSGATDSEAGNTTLELRRHLAAKVYARTAAYDAAIAAHLQKEFSADKNGIATGAHDFGAAGATPALRRESHQKAALYGKFGEYFKQLHGKELSYNNILDLTAATALITEFRDDVPTLAILKHTIRAAWGRGQTCARLGTGVCDRQTAPFAGSSP